MSEMEHGFIHRNVTVVEWPWIPDPVIKEMVLNEARNCDCGQDSTLSFEGLYDNLNWDKEEGKEGAAEKLAALEAFFEQYNLKCSDTIHFWW